MRKKLLIIFTILILIGGGIWFYCCSLINVNSVAIDYFEQLKTETIAAGYSSNFYVVSGKRHQWHNDLLVEFGGAASKSRHLKGEAIDIIVLDVNQDGTANSKDVDIIYNILNRKIIKNKGGIGTYKNDKTRFGKQMIHFDCRGYKARWHR